MEIYFERNVTPPKLEVLGVYDWPIWEKEESTFDWSYDEEERCYFLRGEVVVTPDGGTPHEFKRGDYVVFPKGMKCTWEIRKAVRKHYDIG